MPKIPTYDSQASLKIERPSTREIQAQAPGIRVSPSAFGIESQAMGRFGQIVAKIGENIYKLQAQNELSKANIEASRGRKIIETTEDIEPQGWLERRDKEIQDLRESVLKEMRNPLAKKKFELEFDRDIIDTQFRLKSNYTKLTVGQTLNSFYNERDETENAIYNATSEKEKQLLIDKIGNRYSELGRIGAMTSAGAIKEFRKWQDDLIEGKVKDDIVKNPEAAKILLSAGEYKNLSATQTADWIKVADKRIEYNKKVAEKEQDERWLLNAGDIMSNIKETPTQDIINMVANGDIDPDFGKDMVDWKTDPDSIGYETDEKIWMDIMRESIEPELDLRKFQNRIAKAVANQEIQADDAANLSVFVKEMYTTAIDFKARQTSRSRAIGTAMDTIKAGATMLGLPIKAQYQMTNELLKRISEGLLDNQIDEATKEIVDDKARETQPSTEMLKDIPYGVTAQDGDLNIINENKTQLKPTHVWRDGKLIKIRDAEADTGRR